MKLNLDTCLSHSDIDAIMFRSMYISTRPKRFHPHILLKPNLTYGLKSVERYRFNPDPL